MTTRGGADALRPGGRTVTCSAVDLGTGGPKVGLVSLAGARRLEGPHRRSRPGGSTTAAPCRTPRSGGRSSSTPPAARWPAARCAPSRWWRSASPASGRAPSPSTQPGTRCPTASCGWTRGAAATRGRSSGRPGRVRARGGGRLDPPQRGAPRPPRATTPSVTCCTWTKTSPSVARAARWYLEPVDYLSMRFTGVAAASPASMTAAWLTDTRQAHILDYDPVLVRRSGVNRRQAAAAVPHRIGDRAPSKPTWRPSWGFPPPPKW